MLPQKVHSRQTVVRLSTLRFVFVWWATIDQLIRLVACPNQVFNIRSSLPYTTDVSSWRSATSNILLTSFTSLQLRSLHKLYHSTAWPVDSSSEEITSWILQISLPNRLLSKVWIRLISISKLVSVDISVDCLFLILNSINRGGDRSSRHLPHPSQRECTKGDQSCSSKLLL